MKKVYKYGIVLLAGLAFLITSLKLPEWHYSLVRNSVQKKVVMITNEAETSGGTGVHVKTNKGNVYILTNAHICDHVGKNGMVNVISDVTERTIPRRIIEVSKYSDLCLVEPLPGADYISMGSDPKPGQIVAVVGHPVLMPTTMSRGEIIGEAEVDVMDHIMTDDPDDCNLPKNRKKTVRSFFGDIPVCVVHVNAYLSNVPTLPGNSGSPVVNFYGNLVGLVFAGDSRANWGIFITLKDVKKFLEVY